MRTFSIDLTRLPSSGHGIARMATDGLREGDAIGVFDADTDVFEATVLHAMVGRAEIQVHFDRVLRPA